MGNSSCSTIAINYIFLSYPFEYNVRDEIKKAKQKAKESAKAQARAEKCVWRKNTTTCQPTQNSTCWLLPILSDSIAILVLMLGK